MWFHEFQKDFYWEPHHDAAIRKNFGMKGGTRLREMFTDIRKSRKRPMWIAEEVWKGLCKKWSTSEYIEKRERAKKNRASDLEGLGTSLHTGVSIPHTEHMRRQVKELGCEPTAAELHVRTHQHGADSSRVDRRAHHTGDNFDREWTASQATSEESPSIRMPSVQSSFEMWKKTTGGKKKGRVYSLGATVAAFE